MNGIEIVLTVLVAVAVGALGVVLVMLRRQKAERDLLAAKAAGEGPFAGLRQEAENAAKSIVIEAKDEALRLRQEAEREAREQRTEIARLESRIQQREETIERKVEALDKREGTLRRAEDEARQLRDELSKAQEAQRVALERVAQLTAEEAKAQLLRQLEGELQHEVAAKIRHHELEAKDQAEKKTQAILSQVIQRTAVDHVIESTVSIVTLPTDEMKGRIIGREGRNIRAFEHMTGVDLIIDDTREAVVLSCFDPIRREVARLSLEMLISDGRIHPTRIEECIAKARKEVDARIREAGEKAAFEADVHGIHPELIKLLGRLQYRTSYGQNVLAHSLECCYISGLMAAELKADVKLAKRAALLHDLGKAMTHEKEGPHALLGGEVAERYGEPPAVVRAISSHHLDVEQETVEDIIVQVADAISATRPGARRETIEIYIKRMQKLEEIATSFPGVERAFVIQAGREVRLMVQPDVVDDAGSLVLAREVAQRIEKELEYPGQVRVTVIRETRATDVAK